LNDAKSIAPISLSAFDTNRYLLNLQNGTYNLQNFNLQQHCAEDYITKMARVRFDHRAKCQRWKRFIDEIMCGDKVTSAFLQKALGYALTGDTNACNRSIFYTARARETANQRSQRLSVTSWAITPERFSRRHYPKGHRTELRRRRILRD
jgi:putative DNA primase/helicase